MITKVSYVYAMVNVCGVPVIRRYPIKTESGHLMTNRLWQLLNGNLGHSHNRGHDDYSETEFIGIIWKRPYTILNELRESRIAMQTKLLEMDKHNSLANSQEYIVIPKVATDDYVSGLIAKELDARKSLKQELKRINHQHK